MPKYFSPRDPCRRYRLGEYWQILGQLLANLGESWQILEMAWHENLELSRDLSAGCSVASGLETGGGTASKAKKQHEEIKYQVSFSKFAVLIPRCMIE